MPQMANITVKDAAGADVVLTALTPSSGDRAALWRYDALNTLPLLRPTYQVTTTYNGPRDARRTVVTGSYPISDPVLATVKARIPFRLEATLPLNVDTVDTDDAVVIMQNFIKSALITEVLKSGFNAT
ncbi:TPA_asm: coat protein [ssRNA phage SRR7976323_4]|uniref:Coat protein n=1 Tax=ssRNA phage SRR7976323_4 TaxID=2786691 RepID=A0A8S5L161_9VIRU|nr:coat protein [ssRNA phage SRR7976323_4]DAD51164.1 TPA_asm: coat protein [ssRNA phage SRR7976323_4]